MLPSFQTNDPALARLQTAWAKALNPVVDAPLLQGILLQGLELASGANVIDHRLGRAPQGYIVTRMRGTAATLIDTQESNPRPALTLQITASAATTVDLYVF